MCKYCGRKLEIFECINCYCFEHRCMNCWFEFASNIGGIFKIVGYTKEEEIALVLKTEEYCTVESFYTRNFKK